MSDQRPLLERLDAGAWPQAANMQEAAARIRELETLLKIARQEQAKLDKQGRDARNRIRELEAALERQRDLGADIVMGRKVIVPVEPTEFMEDAAFDIFDANEPSMGDIYRAMIRAAQEEDR